MKKNPPLSSTTIVTRFEESCGTFGEGKKTIVVNDIRLVFLKKTKKKTYFILFYF
jgi:hypothetical protein